MLPKSVLSTYNKFAKIAKITAVNGCKSKIYFIFTDRCHND